MVRFFSQSDLSTCRAFFHHKKIPSGKRRKKEGYDEKANVDASREVLAMNIDELVEGLEEE